jgi:hypothetical protein
VLSPQDRKLNPKPYNRRYAECCLPKIVKALQLAKDPALITTACEALDFLAGQPESRLTLIEGREGAVKTVIRWGAVKILDPKP